MMSLTAAQIGELTAQFFLAAAGTLSFAILFACPRRCLPYCALVGAVGWLWYELLTLLGADAATASLLAVIPLTILTRVFAITQKTPVTVFLLTGIFPLVPGAGIYYTAYYFIQNEEEVRPSQSSRFARCQLPRKGELFLLLTGRCLKLPPSGELANVVSLRGFIRSLGEGGKAAGFDGRGCAPTQKQLQTFYIKIKRCRQAAFNLPASSCLCDQFSST